MAIATMAECVLRAKAVIHATQNAMQRGVRRRRYETGANCKRKQAIEACMGDPQLPYHTVAYSSVLNYTDTHA